MTPYVCKTCGAPLGTEDRPERADQHRARFEGLRLETHSPETSSDVQDLPSTPPPPQYIEDLIATIEFFEFHRIKLASGPLLPWTWVVHAQRHLEDRLNRYLRG